MQFEVSVFITFEGGEGAGKTTLIEHVARQLALEGYEIVRTREPGGTPLGEKIRSLVLEHSGFAISPITELYLFLASRAQHVAELIGPALQAGKIVLCDRFNDSTVAYQGAARGLGVKEVRHLCDFACQMTRPTLTIYLDIDPKIGLARVQKVRKKDRMEAEQISFHEKIRAAFCAIHDPERFHLIDASNPPDVVFQEAMHLIRGKLT